MNFLFANSLSLLVTSGWYFFDSLRNFSLTTVISTSVFWSGCSNSSSSRSLSTSLCLNMGRWAKEFCLYPLNGVLLFYPFLWSVEKFWFFWYNIWAHTWFLFDYDEWKQSIILYLQRWNLYQFICNDFIILFFLSNPSILIVFYANTSWLPSSS